VKRELKREQSISPIFVYEEPFYYIFIKKWFVFILIISKIVVGIVIRIKLTIREIVL
jgi:hypothetical protein